MSDMEKNVKKSYVYKDNGNIFTAYAAVVNDRKDVRKVVQYLYNKPEVVDATTNSVAYRLKEGDRLVEIWHDDDEMGCWKENDECV